MVGLDVLSGGGERSQASNVILWGCLDGVKFRDGEFGLALEKKSESTS